MAQPTTTPHLSPSSGRAWIGAIAVLLLALAWIYGYGIAAYPLKWEEPRRALVAFEMVERQDYIVPHLLGEPYRNKPPLHNWLIALGAGFDSDRIVPFTVRLPSLLAVFGTALLLFALGSGPRHARHPLPALLFLTTAAVIQFGRAGETDMLFTFFLMAAFAAFELGRRRSSPSLQWVASQAAVGLAVLAKGIAPLYFYPPILFLVWRRRADFPCSARAFVLGALVLLLIIATWIVPFALESSLPALTRQAGAEIAERTPLHQPAPGANKQPPYPVMLLLAGSPWSLVLLALVLPRARRAAAGLRAEPYLVLAIAVVVWGIIAFAVVPRARPRYLLPVLPLAAVIAAFVLGAFGARSAASSADIRRPVLAGGTAWSALAGVFFLFVLVSGPTALTATPPPARLALTIATAAVGSLVMIAAAWTSRRANPLAVWILALGLLYGVIFTGFWERRDADKGTRALRAAEVLAAAVPDETIPLVCHKDFDRRVVYALAHRLGRPLTVAVPAGEYLFVARDGDQPPPAAERVALGHGVAAYRVAAPGAQR